MGSIHIKKQYGDTMPLQYTSNYQIVWLAEKYAGRSNPSHIQQIITDVCDVFGITKEQMTGNGRQFELVIPRQICIYVSKRKTGLSHEWIGRILKKHHTQVTHSIQTVRKHLETEDTVFMTYWNRYISESMIYK